jgi:hypothetical protein
MIFSAMMSANLQKDVKHLLGFALHPLLTIDTSEKTVNSVAHFKPIIAASLQGTVPEISGGLRAIRSIFSGICQHAFLNLFAEELLPQLVIIATKAV